MFTRRELATRISAALSALAGVAFSKPDSIFLRYEAPTVFVDPPPAVSEALTVADIRIARQTLEEHAAFKHPSFYGRVREHMFNSPVSWQHKVRLRVFNSKDQHVFDMHPDPAGEFFVATVDSPCEVSDFDIYFDGVLIGSKEMVYGRYMAMGDTLRIDITETFSGNLRPRAEPPVG